MITVELPFGIDRKTWNWTGVYEGRDTQDIGFSHPDNKANLIGCWLLAMFDATAKPVYSGRAKEWFRVMKSRMNLKDDGTYRIWNYREPAGSWDYKSNGLPKSTRLEFTTNGGYYDIDVEGIVAAYDHGLIFNKEDINHLLRPVWQKSTTGPDQFHMMKQTKFNSNQAASSWDGLWSAPWYLDIQRALSRG